MNRISVGTILIKDLGQPAHCRARYNRLLTKVDACVKSSKVKWFCSRLPVQTDRIKKNSDRRKYSGIYQTVKQKH
jgi:hypothetical protein